MSRLETKISSSMYSMKLTLQSTGLCEFIRLVVLGLASVYTWFYTSAKLLCKEHFGEVSASTKCGSYHFVFFSVCMHIYIWCRKYFMVEHLCVQNFLELFILLAKFTTCKDTAVKSFTRVFNDKVIVMFEPTNILTINNAPIHRITLTMVLSLFANFNIRFRVPA